MSIADTITSSTLYGMVLPEFRRHRPYALDLEGQRMASEIAEKMGDDYSGNLVYLYADVVTYLVSLNFNWPEPLVSEDGEEVEGTAPPESYTNLEIWWKQHQAGADMLAQYQYAITQIDGRVWQDLTVAMRKSTQAWKPIEWRKEDELTDKQRADPLSEQPEATLETT